MYEYLHYLLIFPVLSIVYMIVYSIAITGVAYHLIFEMIGFFCMPPKEKAVCGKIRVSACINRCLIMLFAIGSIVATGGNIYFLYYFLISG